MENKELVKLSELIKLRNKVEIEAAEILEKPLLIGNVGDYIASEVFDIELHKDKKKKACDGYFRSGLLKGKSVNIKFYGRRGRLLDINQEALPDYYLVMMGEPTKLSRCPWNIESVHLFRAEEIEEELKARVKLGTATSVRQRYWEKAIIYPHNNSEAYKISVEQFEMLELFAPEKE